MQEHVFQLTQLTQLLCTHVNPRVEMHGEDKVFAMDFSFSMEGAGEILDLFDPMIRTTLFCNRAAEAGQQELPDALAVLPNRRLPGLAEKQSWRKGDRLQGYRLIVDYGLGEEGGSNVDLTDCVLSSQWFEHKENNAAKIGFLVSYAGDELSNETIRGRLVGLAGQTAHVQLIAGNLRKLVSKGPGRPKKTDDGHTASLPGTDDDGGGTSGPEDAGSDDGGGERDATEQFLEQHGT